ncbi:MAG: DUF4186 domain-containing protein [Thermodesulfobacteriales bacterium]|nr:MAG: DUF4186 domain-containing protein [Thermodesulfobacteriales bacterium]
MNDLDVLFEKLAKSRFRSRFKLDGKELEYLNSKGISIILEHGRDFINTRLAPANPPNDGKQTPMRNHPIFIAQHATATCCRGCLQKWHQIPNKDHELSQQEKDYVFSVLELWLITYK